MKVLRTASNVVLAALVALVVLVAQVVAAQTRQRTLTFDGADASLTSFAVWPGDVDESGAAAVDVCAAVPAKDGSRVESACERVRIAAPWSAAKALRAWRVARGLE